MSALEETFEAIVRKVIREELGSLIIEQPEALKTAEQVATDLNVNKQKVYSLVREGELEAIRISKRGMRFAPSAIRDFQLRRGIKAA